MTIKVVYENGVFRPLKPIRDVREGTEAEVTVKKTVTSTPTSKEAIESMMAIINLPQQDNGKKFSGEDHDKILYGDPHQS
ncbi:MAG: antitoxin family protein [Gemmatales bacterium]